MLCSTYLFWCPVVVLLVDRVGATLACQHCGFKAQGRVFCPQCRKKMRPSQPAPVDLADEYARRRDALPAARPVDGCTACERAPADWAQFCVVRSYIVFFRWRRSGQQLCRDCARSALRDAQYQCLTRGWWGLLFGPIANLVAIARNTTEWVRIRRLPEPEGPPSPPVQHPVHRRPSAYVATVAAATIAALVLLSPMLVRTPPDTPPNAPQHLQQALSTPAQPSTPTPSAPAWTGALSGLALQTPHGWHHEPDLKLPVASLSKLFKHPAAVRADLQALNYQQGFDRAFFRPTPRVVVEEQLWKFDTADDANGWMLFWLSANEPRSGSTYRTSFPLDGTAYGNGYLARARDPYGFSYGVAVAQLGNIIIHVRYSSLAPVSRADLAHWLSTATKFAQPALAS